MLIVFCSSKLGIVRPLIQLLIFVTDTWSLLAMSHLYFCRCSLLIAAVAV